MADDTKYPRDFLYVPKNFGSDLEARWRDDSAPKEIGALGAAWYQHRYVLRARPRIVEVFGNEMNFANAISELIKAPYSVGNVTGRLNGSRWARMEDYMLWTQLLGGRCFHRIKKRKKALPPPELMGSSLRPEPRPR